MSSLKELLDIAVDDLIDVAGRNKRQRAQVLRPDLKRLFAEFYAPYADRVVASLEKWAGNDEGWPGTETMKRLVIRQAAFELTNAVLEDVFGIPGE